MAEPSYPDTAVSEITSIYDADTFRANIDGWPDTIGKRIPIIVNGIDAPEIKGKCDKEKQLARKAKMFTVEALREGKRIDLRNMQRGKYFRIIADVYIDGRSLGTELIKNGLARAYDGGKRLGCCTSLHSGLRPSFHSVCNLNFVSVLQVCILCTLLVPSVSARPLASPHYVLDIAIPSSTLSAFSP